MSTRNFKFVVFGAHLVLLGIMVWLFTHRDIAYDIGIFSRLAPVASLYDTTQLSWIGNVREVAHIILTLFDGLGGVLMVMYGLRRKNEIAKYFAVAIGSQLIFSSALSLTLLGLVVSGGVWHLLSALVAVAMSGSAVITFSALTLFWKDLVDVGQQQDKLFNENAIKTKPGD